MSNRITQIKKEFLIRKGQAATVPVDQAETVIYRTGGRGSKQGAKLQYLKKVITDNGGTPQGKYESQLAREAVVALGKTPAKRLSENWRVIYLYA